MKRLLLMAALLFATSPAFAGSVIITASGFSTWPTSAPTAWPSTLTWPPTGNTTPNTAKTYTVNDADLLSIFAWVANSNQATLCPSNPPCTVTGAQLLLDWLQMSIVNGTLGAVQKFQTPAPVPPPPITIQ